MSRAVSRGGVEGGAGERCSADADVHRASAFFAYGGNEQAWMTNGVAVALALIGVLVFAGATVMAALGRRWRRR